MRMESVWSSNSTIESDSDGGQGGGPSSAALLGVAVRVCLAMSLMLLVEKACMTVVLFLLKCKLIVSSLLLMNAASAAVDEEVDLEVSTPRANYNYPMVLVQIPMYNERQVYQLSIGAVCRLSWPPDRIIVQVLDDSTEKVIKVAVEEECRRWRSSKGVDVRYVTREGRDGYKAGALREGMKCPYAMHCQYVAIFDADFQPDPDFLLRSIPILSRNPCAGLVQARWTFVNADHCLLTRMQQLSLDYHFTIEQQFGSSTHAFFGFNGTAGVWRISAMNEAGGWKDRTTVEDMDLAVRATLKGWKFLYVHDLEVKSELPSTFKAYRYQQHRWSCGPANLFRKMFIDILNNKKVTVWKKAYVIYSFFFVRKIVAHVVTFVFYCVVVPTAVFFPDVEIPTWGAVYVPLAITILNALGTYPRSSLHLLLLWILFENVMSLHRTKATLAGLLEVGQVNQWVVTEKLGDALRSNVTKTKTTPSSVGAPKRAWMAKVGTRLHLLEIGVGAYLLLCAYGDLCFGINHYYLFLFPQAFSFLIIGFGYVGTFGP